MKPAFIKLLWRIAYFSYKLGFPQGLYILIKITIGKGESRIKLPGIKSWIFIRKSTKDIDVFEQVFVHRDYELDQVTFTPQLILDAGAYTGLSTIFFANKYPTATIIAIEPEPSNFELLLKNVSSYVNIIPIRAALWKSKEKLTIENPQMEEWTSRVRESIISEISTVQGITVDELLDNRLYENIILKLDIEGAEKEIFEEGYESWLNKIDVLIVELHDWIEPGCSTSFYRATSQYQFNQFIRSENIILIRYLPEHSEAL